jgi:glucarate dehydratase
MTKLAITAVTLRRIRLPLDMVYVSSMYVMNDTYRTVVTLETDAGITGIGETLGTEECFALASTLAKGWLGRDARDRLGLRRAFGRSVFDNRNGRNGWSAFAGLELAAWDATGKAWGLGLADLMGGAVRRDIEVVCPLPAVMVPGVVGRAELLALFRDPKNAQGVVDYALDQRAKHGFRCFKYKSAAASARYDLAVMQALREGLGAEAQLRFDPNAAYGPAEATALCQRMEPLGLEFYEDPTDDIEGLANLRARVTRPVATNMCVIQLDHLAAAIRRDAIDVVLADLFMWGGVANYRVMADVATAFGLDVAIHSLFETGIGTTANLHLAAALPQVKRANDSGHHVIAADVLAEPMPITGGRMRLPDKPGLGVALDPDKLAKLTVKETTVRA